MELPYAVPHVEHIPALKVESEPAEVHAFRVETLQGYTNSAVWQTYYGHCSLRELPLPQNGRLPAQTEVVLATGTIPLVLPGWCGCGGACEYRSILVRLYRRGYETIEVEPGDKRKLVWRKVSDVLDRERAIDQLLGSTDLTWPLKPDLTGLIRLHAGNKDHNKVLRFAAGEYDMLALDLPQDAQSIELRDRLKLKAKSLRDWSREHSAL